MAATVPITFQRAMAMPRDGFLLSVINDAAVVLPAFGFVTIVYLVLVFLVVARMRALDLKLIVLGVLTSVAAAWCGLLTPAEGVSLQGRAGQPGQVGLTLGFGDGAAVLARVAILLILGGLACMVLTRWYSPSDPAGQPRDIP